MAEPRGPALHPALVRTYNTLGVPLDAIERLRSRYEQYEVPPCRICGQPLAVASMGGGRLTEYACGSNDAKASVVWSGMRPVEDPLHDHYYRSRWTAPTHPDEDVIWLINAYEALTGAPA